MWVVGLVVAIAILFVAWNFRDPNLSLKSTWADANVKCLSQNDRVAQNLRAHLTVFVDNVPETIPGNVGVLNNCIAEIHTQNASGDVYVSSAHVDVFTLGQFFTVWGKPLMRNRYNLTVSVNGTGYMENEHFYSTIPLKDGEDIRLEYFTKK